MNSVAIRPVEKRDIEVLHALIYDLAVNQNEAAFFTVTPERLSETGFGDAPLWQGYLAEIDDQAVGYVTFTRDFHVWSGAPRITIDDLYVRPEFRSHGLGEKLMRQIFMHAEAGGAFVSWTVQTDNHRAIEFYQRLGAKYHVTGKCGWRAG